jgi:hypothetical protein
MASVPTHGRHSEDETSYCRFVCRIAENETIPANETAEHMVASNNYSVAFAKMLLAVTRPEFLVASTVAKQSASTSGGNLLMLEDEAESIVRDLKVVEASYGTDILLLTVVCGYVERVLANNRVERYLSKHKPDILSSLRSGLADAKRAKFPTA